MDRNAILENRNDPIEMTFCYQLFELEIFNEKLFFELIDGINKHLFSERSDKGKPDREMLSFLSWFVMGVMHCVICHTDGGDRYIIKQFDMISWYEVYELKLSSLLNRAFSLM